MSRENIPPVGITMGDPAGIGPEIIIKLFRQPLSHKAIVFGDMKCLETYASRLGYVDVKFKLIHEIGDVQEHCQNEIPVYQCNSNADGVFEFGVASAYGGDVSFQAFQKAVDYADEGKISAIVTAPINKHAWKLGGHDYAGHTEVLDKYTEKTSHVSMVLLNDELRTVLVSDHIPLSEVPKHITMESVCIALENAHQCAFLLGFDNPRIAVAGLNPHAGEHGKFGNEEIEIIEPVIATFRESSTQVYGPLPPDTVFMRARKGEFDFVVAMYHDQALIPVKYLGLDKGVNITAGCKFIRTSVDHGTGYDIAGKGIADERSLRIAYELALEMVDRKALLDAGRG
ncbi:4-hydroxythreonine-4-phosphate dehydrogenase [Taylorella equigenitalis 14/56]|uniref:4-hydroxythreonine-4-phosphate dehydrogenase n=1 Tax=Taylorella equigenitalis 14/56 TaxID=1091497 RepID=I7IIQ3_9BURK|nr:4-hydroxythreonine-4-phosphate dehydrogenase PdxA [Taylorella equigenitalis]ASY30951.1 4-hydroxythreonine-4-phosphate dehydrogenase PdxA [Taylorella equigenitalis]ASY42718.1 4-hydroxythreonine-4-phosphate dehydrogenase PdxA [Taylorella equigenitalis]KOS59554.1 4-hydroxythreonine-4-phosphate dehydrogenase [Taylorella equigenitalis]RBA26587.1 4-hydroxythreonine-4-phosphate dehydrogenase PdxA [Taylorella equigenitalis]WDU54584.1 4-hydroxythreonine-4-phosphate dehydrogenase PdxA [Taylorella equ